MRQKISTHVDLGTEWRVLHAQTWDNNLLYDEITFKVDYFFLSKTFLVTYFLIGLYFKVYYCRYGRILILKISSPVIEETRVMWLGLGEAFNLSDNLNHLSMCFLPQDKFKLNFFLANYRREGEEAEKEQSKVVTSGREGVGVWRKEGGRLGARRKEEERGAEAGGWRGGERRFGTWKSREGERGAEAGWWRREKGGKERENGQALEERRGERKGWNGTGGGWRRGGEAGSWLMDGDRRRGAEADDWRREKGRREDEGWFMSRGGKTGGGRRMEGGDGRRMEGGDGRVGWLEKKLGSLYVE